MTICFIDFLSSFCPLVLAQPRVKLVSLFYTGKADSCLTAAIPDLFWAPKPNQTGVEL